MVRMLQFYRYAARGAANARLDDNVSFGRRILERRTWAKEPPRHRWTRGCWRRHARRLGLVTMEWQYVAWVESAGRNLPAWLPHNPPADPHRNKKTRARRASLCCRRKS